MRLAALTLAALALAGCASPSAPDDAGAAAPRWSFTDIDGATWSSDAPARSATVLFFMATWCPTCKQEAPMLAEIHASHEANDVQFLTLDFDPTESEEQLRAWSERYAQPWPHGIDEGLRVARALGVRAESGVVVLDASGRIVDAWEHGLATSASVQRALEQALTA